MRLGYCVESFLDMSVSIHASVKDATPIARPLLPLSGFNPRICKRCDSCSYRLTDGRIVSIHASVKDATQIKQGGGLIIGVSIHASVKDATQRLLFHHYIDLSFNPRICKRCDISIPKSQPPLYVSIHASVKDATLSRAIAIILWPVSIHASVKDATFWRWGRRFCRLVSIHASVKDATFVAVPLVKSDGFNPRICKRCDSEDGRFLHHIQFQSTHL